LVVTLKKGAQVLDRGACEHAPRAMEALVKIAMSGKSDARVAAASTRSHLFGVVVLALLTAALAILRRASRLSNFF
jgi:hypothetical protein